MNLAVSYGQRLRAGGCQQAQELDSDLLIHDRGVGVGLFSFKLRMVATVMTMRMVMPTMPRPPQTSDLRTIYAASVKLAIRNISRFLAI